MVFFMVVASFVRRAVDRRPFPTNPATPLVCKP